jgi:hypothetical protein
MFNEDNITIYNRIKDRNGYTYYRTVLKGVEVQQKRSATVSNTLNIAYSTSIFIDKPVNNTKSYISEKEFLKLSEKDKQKYFTFGTGDKIVADVVEKEVNADFSITQLESSYEVLTIKGLKNFPCHFEVEAV